MPFINNLINILWCICILWSTSLCAQINTDSLSSSKSYPFALEAMNYAYGYSFGKDLMEKTDFNKTNLPLKDLLKGLKEGLQPDSIVLQQSNVYIDKIMLDSSQSEGLQNDQTAYYLAYSAFGNMLQNFDINPNDFKFSAIKKGLSDYYKSIDPKYAIEQMDSMLNLYFSLKQARIQQQLKDKFEALAQYNLQQADEFMAQNTAKKGIKSLPSGLQYQIIKEGTGLVPASNNRVVVHYTGTLLDDRVFDSSIDRGEPAEFVVRNVIKGLQEGLKLMKAGSRFRFFVPPNLGYGVNGPASIPPNSVLLFDLELLQVDEGPALDSASVQMSYSYGFMVGQSLSQLALTTSELNPNFFVQGFVKGFEASALDRQTVERLLKSRLESGKAAESNAAAQKIAFSIGLSSSSGVATQLGVRQLDFDFNALGKGYADAVGNKKALFSDTQMSQFLQSFFEPKQALKEKELKQNNQALWAKNSKEGADFLTKNAQNDSVTVLENGLQYEVLRQAEGPKPSLTSTVTTHYHGTLIDGTVFDSSIERGEAASFPLSAVIEGWQIGIPLMSVGAKYRFYIPAALAYKNKGTGAMIEPGATLIFEVELLKIN